MYGQLPRAGKLEAGIRASNQLRSRSLRLACVSVSLSRTGTRSHPPPSEGRSRSQGKPRFKRWRNRLYLLMGEASRPQNKEVWIEGGRDPFLYSTILSLRSPNELCEKSPRGERQISLYAFLFLLGFEPTEH